MMLTIKIRRLERAKSLQKETDELLSDFDKTNPSNI